METNEWNSPATLLSEDNKMSRRPLIQCTAAVMSALHARVNMKYGQNRDRPPQKSERRTPVQAAPTTFCLMMWLYVK